MPSVPVFRRCIDTNRALENLTETVSRPSRDTCPPLQCEFAQEANTVGNSVKGWQVFSLNICFLAGAVCFAMDTGCFAGKSLHSKF